MRYRIQEHKSSDYFLPQVRIWFLWHVIDADGIAYLQKSPLGVQRIQAAHSRIDKHRASMVKVTKVPEWKTVWDTDHPEEIPCF